MRKCFLREIWIISYNIIISLLFHSNYNVQAVPHLWSYLLYHAKFAVYLVKLSSYMNERPNDLYKKINKQHFTHNFKWIRMIWCVWKCMIKKKYARRSTPKPSANHMKTWCDHTNSCKFTTNSPKLVMNCHDSVFLISQLLYSEYHTMNSLSFIKTFGSRMVFLVS